MKMKKGVIAIVTAALMLTLVTTSALAADWGRGSGARVQNTVSTTTTAVAAADSSTQTNPYYGRGGCHYLDVDGDGVYDYCAGAINPYLDADGDGVCDSCGLYVGRGAIPTSDTGSYTGDGLWGCYGYGYGDCYSYGGGCHGNGGCGRYGYGYNSGSAAAGSAGATSVGYGYRGGCRR